MRQRPLAESKGNTFTLHVLLTHTSDNLGHVNVRPLGARHHHHLEVVELCQGPLGGASCLVSGVIEDSVHHILEGLPQRVTRRRLQLVLVRLLDDLVHVLLGLRDSVQDVSVGGGVGNGVTDTDAVSLNHQPVVDHGLDVSVEETIEVVTHLQLTHVHQGAGRSSQSLLAQDASDQFSILDEDSGVSGGDPVIGSSILVIRMDGVEPHTVDIAGDDQGEQLLPGPKGLGLQDCGDRHLAVPAGQEHEQVHHGFLVNEDVPLGHLPDGGEGVLHNAHDGLVALRGDDLPRRDMDVLNLGSGLHGLRHVEVHLVPVKVSVVGRGVREVHPEGGPGQHLDPVTHHTHFMQSGLSVEDHQVTISHVSLHSVATLEVEVTALGMVSQVNPLPSVTDDVLGPRILAVTLPHQMLHLVDVERGHNLGEGEVLGDAPGHAHLVNPQVRVWGDDSPSTEVHSLAHQVSSDSPFFTLQPGLNGLQRSATFLHGSWETRHVVIRQRGHVELKHLDVLQDDVGGRPLLLVPDQLVVGLQDVRQLVGQVILIPGRAKHHHGRSDAERRHGHSRDQHPVRSGELGIHAEDVAFLV